MERIDASVLDLQEKVVSINRVSKTVKGGRVMKFSALIVVGNGDGIVGYGIGKAAEVPEAIRKGVEDARKHLVRVSMKGTTIPRNCWCIRRSKNPYETSCSWYWCYRRWRSSCRSGSSRYQRYSYKISPLKKPRQRCCCNSSRSCIC